MKASTSDMEVPNASALRRPTSACYSETHLYGFGLSVGARTLHRSTVYGLKSLLLPVEYIRCRETRYVLQHADIAPGQRVLDVGSPKLLSLFLASRVRAHVYATDLLDYFVARYGAYADAVLGTNRGLYVMETQDARCLSYGDGSFDRVFSISAIEHIEGDGDSRAITEIARVLRPGGLACLTVPWGLAGYVEDFVPADGRDLYWAKGRGSEPIFYQRAYDRPQLERRLLCDPRLELIDLSFVGERSWPVERFVAGRGVPRVIRFALAPLHFSLSRVFLGPLGENERSKKKVACLTLRKKS